jgi:hypothetical protein
VLSEKMPRKARIDAPDALQHIIIRGIERNKIYRDAKDKYVFSKRFGKVHEQPRNIMDGY